MSDISKRPYTKKTLERIAKFDELGVRCQWYTRRGRCTRFGTNWRIDQGRYCDQHARMAWGPSAAWL